AIDNAQGKLDDAETAINNLPEGSAKDDLLGELATEQEKLDGINVPESDQAALDAAQAALDEAKAAVEAAQTALDNANADNTITHNEVAILEAIRDDAQAKLDAAEGAIASLPEGSAKADLQAELEALENITVPPVSEDYLEALAAVKSAEDAYAAAHQAQENALLDGIITPEEVEFLNNARDEAEALKEAAQEKVGALNEGAAQDGLQGRLDALENIGEAVVTGEYADAVEAVEAAEAKYAAADAKLAAAQEDSTITPEEVIALEVARDLANATKGAAQEKVDLLPDSDLKDGLQDRLDALDPITVPPVTPSYADALAAVEAAEEAYVNAEAALADAQEDSTITPEEVTLLEGALLVAEAAKAAAQGKVNGLPTGDAKNGLQGRLDMLEFEVPPVSDDYTDAVDALNAAKDAIDAAEQALEDAIADGKVEQSEIDALNDAITNAQGKLNDAKDAINALPEGSAKGALVTEAGT
ncbi:GA-like domain-containing protein, partial [Acinetobacter towneri]|uniref:GA-like domain-containing protein n=1 Tax=Acinetobacter towneri TaxID=202956 RepID=UPI0034D66A82